VVEIEDNAATIQVGIVVDSVSEVVNIKGEKHTVLRNVERGYFTHLIPRTCVTHHKVGVFATNSY
jgi:hypothetical protein